MLQFEWDYRKADENFKKHGVAFDEAVTIFSDPMALTFFDTDHSENEERDRTYGISNKGHLLVVVHTERENIIRIISARKATRNEENIYPEG